MAKSFNEIYAEAMALSNNSEALMSNITKAAMAAGKLTAETKRDLELFKELREATKDISANLEEAGKRNITSEAVELARINDRLVKQQKKVELALRKKQEYQQKGLKNLEAGADKYYAKQLQALKEIEKEEAQNAQRAKDRLRQVGREMDNLNSRASGTIFDPTVGFFNSTGAELKDYDKTLDYMEKKNQDLADSFGDALSGSIDTMQSRFDSLVRGSGNFFRDLGEAGRLAREGNKKKAAKGEKISIFNKVLGNIGKMSRGLTLLGKAIAGFAGIAAGLFAIFKVAQMIEEKIKEVNKELVDAYGATDLMYEGMENTYEAINKARKEFTDADFAYEMGETLEGARGLVAQLNEMGVNLRTTKGDFEGIKELTVGLKAASVALGTDFGTVTAFTQQFKEELGYAVKDGELLDKMGDSFARIRDVAMQSGFSTNRFFQVIQGLSDGIGEMNIRIGETSRMFFNMSKVLGPKAAQAFTQGLMGGFRGEGIQERFKRLIIMGGSKKILKRTAARTVKELGRQLTTDQAKLLSDSGIDLKGDLSKVTDKQLEKAMGNLRRGSADKNAGRARADELMRAVRLARGGSGGLSDQAMALGELDLSGTMSAQMKQLYQIQGDKGFQGITAIGMEKLVQMTGKSLEELEQMRKIDMAMRSDFAKVKEIQDGLNKDGQPLTPDEMRKALKDQGFDQLAVNDAGQITDLAGNIIGDDLQSFIEAQGSDYDDMKSDALDQISLLQQVRDATMTSADMINNYLGDKIQELNDPLNALAADKDGYAKQKEATDRLRDRKEVIKGEAEARKLEETKLVQEKEREISKIKDPRLVKEKKEELRQLKEKHAERRKQEEARLTLLDARMREISKGKVKGDTVDDIVSNSFEKGQDALLRRGAKGQEALAQQLPNQQGLMDAILRKEGFKTEGEMALKIKRGGEEGEALRKRLKKKYNMEMDLSATATSYDTMGLNIYRNKRQTGLFSREGQRAGEGFGLTKSELLVRKNRYLRGKSGMALIEQLRRQGLDSESFKGTHRKKTGLGGLYLKNSFTTSTSRVRQQANILGNEQARGDMEGAALNQSNQLQDINEALSKLDPSDPKYQSEMDKLENKRLKVLAKNRAMFDRDKRMNVEALLEVDKKKLENEFKSSGLLEENASLGNNLGRVISDLDSKIATETDADKLERLKDQRRDIRRFYAKDGLSEPGMDKPLLIHNGFEMEGTKNDSVAFFDQSKGGGRGGRGGRGGGGNTYNIIVPKGSAPTQTGAIVKGFQIAGHA